MPQQKKTRSIVVFGPILSLTLLLLQLPLSVPQVSALASDSAAHSAPKTIRRAVPVVAMVTPETSPALLPVVDQADIHEEDKVMVNNVLQLLPPSCLSTLKNFYMPYKTLDSRGYAGSDTVIVQGTLPMNEKRGVLIHEALGHFLDLGCLQGTPDSGSSSFRDGAKTFYQNDPSVAFYSINWQTEKKMKPGTPDADFVTGYAKTDCFEDLAESVAFYVLKPDGFRARAKTNPALAKKLTWIETYAFPAHPSLAIGLTKDMKKIPWDATKLPYVWLDTARVAMTDRK